MSNTDITITGRLVRDPNVGTAPSTGTAYAHLRVLVNERYYDEASGEWKDKGDPTGYDVTAWGRQAQAVADYALRKGQRVTVESHKPIELDTSYTDPDTGEVKPTFKLTASRILLDLADAARDAAAAA